MSTTRSHSSITRDARERMKATGQRFTEARADVLEIRELMESDDLAYAEAEAEYDDPRNQLLCETCGWTVGMVCPECPGCGCYNGRCSGWRHREYMLDADPLALADMYACEECGGDTRNHYSCECD